MAQLKAAKPQEATNSILIPFQAKWKEPILESRISVVFRKRGPKSRELNWIYCYVKAPESAILARCKISRYETLPLNKATTLCEFAGLTEVELRQYAAGYDSLAVFRLATIQPARRPVSLKELAADFHFKPVQGFLILSKDGKTQLDKALGF